MAIVCTRRRSICASGQHAQRRRNCLGILPLQLRRSELYPPFRLLLCTVFCCFASQRPVKRLHGMGLCAQPRKPLFPCYLLPLGAWTARSVSVCFLSKASSLCSGGAPHHWIWPTGLCQVLCGNELPVTLTHHIFKHLPAEQARIAVVQGINTTGTLALPFLPLINLEAPDFSAQLEQPPKRNAKRTSP